MTTHSKMTTDEYDKILDDIRKNHHFVEIREPSTNITISELTKIYKALNDPTFGTEEIIRMVENKIDDCF